jgi:hypothetical protein
MKRVKCLHIRRKEPGSLPDPDLTLNGWYTVIDEKVDVMGDDPWIRVKLSNKRSIDRPRYMFSRIFQE